MNDHYTDFSIIACKQTTKEKTIQQEEKPDNLRQFITKNQAKSTMLKT